MVSQSHVDSVKLVYILYFIAYVAQITWIAGVIVSECVGRTNWSPLSGMTLIAVTIALAPTIDWNTYLKREGADPVTASHFTYQIRTFWIGLLYIFLGVLLMIIGIGWLIWFFAVVWSLIRNIKGFFAMSDNKPIEDPETWLW